MKPWMPLLLGAALIVGCAAPALAFSSQYQSDQQMDRERNTQAYNDGYAQGQADARSHTSRNDQAAPSRWTKDDDTRAYRQGYDAGYDNIMNNGSARENAGIPPNMPHGDQQATQFGYQDGLAAGRADQRKGHKFDPHDHGLYKDGEHGWTSTLGTKDEYKNLYREAFVKGYEDGFRGNGPH
jgi:hypothetical protein